MELVEKEFPYLFKETFSIEKLPKCFGGTFIPLNIIFCDGDYRISFREASVGVMGYRSRVCERKLEGFDEMNIYFGLIYDLVFNENLKCVPELETRRKKMIENLGKFLTNEKHFKCLERLNLEGRDENEKVLQEVLAVHLFGPLLDNADVKVDNTRYKTTDNVKCKYCSTPVVKADTSFGNSAVWHGHGDIILEHSVVALELEEDEEEDESTLSYRLEEYTDANEPAAKRMRAICSGDNIKSNQETTFNATIIAGNDYLPNGPKAIPYKRESVKENNKTLSQVLAQTITNAFLQVRLHPYLQKQFIPSFLANHQYVTIHMYNPTEDILLTQCRAMPIIHDEGKLHYETILSIWLALNMFEFSKARQTPSCYYLDEGSKLKKSNFHRLIREDTLRLYFDELHMPLKKSRSLKKEYEVDSEIARQHLNKCLNKLVGGLPVE